MKSLSSGKEMSDMSVHAVMPKLMPDCEVLETFTRETCAVQDAKVVTDLHHATRNATS